MPDILLIQPPIQDFYLTAKRTIPYGLACIAAALEQSGFSTDIFDALATPKSRAIDLPDEMKFLTAFHGRPDISPFALFHGYKHFGYSFDHIGTIGQQARNSGVFLVGISSLFTPYSDMALKTAEVVKKYHPDCKIVLGGHHPTVFPAQVLDNPAVDFVLRGEGEVAMSQLAQAIKHGNSGNDGSRNIPGIAFRKSDGTIHCNPPAVIDRPDRQPLPAIDKINHKFYARRKRGCAVIVASRGCPLRCSYCVMGTDAVKFRQRSVASVLKEIEMAVMEYGVGFIDFEDEHLTLARQWFMKLLDGLQVLFQKIGVADIELRAMNGLYPLSLDESMIVAMKAAGFKTLNLSVGTFDPAQQNRFNRLDVGTAHDQVVRWCEKHGLEAVSYIIAGAPDQIPETTLNDLGRLLHQNTIVGLSVFYPAPGSRDFTLAAELDMLPDHFSLMRSSALPVAHTTTRAEIMTLLRLSRIVNFIKFLQKKNIPIPRPKAFPGVIDEAILDRGSKTGRDRTVAGLRLLSWFLHDARIRGMTPSGHAYEHVSTPELTRRFIDRYIAL